MKRPLFFLLVNILFFFTCAYGQIIFQKTFSGYYNQGYAQSVRQTDDNGYILAGTVINQGSGSSVFLIKTDSWGDTLWTRTYLETSSYGHLADQTFDSGYIFFGSVDNNNIIYLAKTNPYGDTIWTRTFDAINNELPTFSLQTNDGGFILTGHSNSFGSGQNDLFLIKLNGTGDTLWTKAYGGSSDELSVSALQTADGGYLVGGITDGFGALNMDPYLIKTDSNGLVLWSKLLYNAAPFTSIAETSDSGFILSGQNRLTKINKDGGFLWSKYFTIPTIQILSVQQTDDGGYIAAGTGDLFHDDAHLLRTDSAGNILWLNAYGTGDPDGAQFVDKTDDGGYILAGCTFNFGDSAGVYLIKTDSNGYSGCFQHSDTTNSVDTIIQITNPTTITTPASFSIGFPSITYGHIDSTHTICLSLNINALSPLQTKISLVPNPATSEFTIMAQDHPGLVCVEIFNAIGKYFQVIRNIQKSDHAIDCRDYPPGIYFIRVQTETGFTVQKLIKQ